MRDSNYELLRIILMIFIVLHHFIVAGLNNIGYNEPFILNSTNVISVVIESFIVMAVNAFVLISGYFGIKLKSKGVCKLWIQCAFYAIVIYLIVYCGVRGEKIWIPSIAKNVFVFFSGQYWFATHYFLLLLLAPLLNKIIDNCSQMELLSVLVLLSLINVVYGFLAGWNVGFNANGYSVINFIWLYFIGRYLNLVNLVKSNIQFRYKVVLGYIISSILIALSAIGMYVITDNVDAYKVFAYSNPLVILSSIFFFLIFASFKMQNKWINWFASSAFAVYLIHSNTYIQPYRNYFIHTLFGPNVPIFVMVLCLMLIAIFTYIVCVLIDKIRIIFTCKLEKQLVKKLNWLISRSLRLINEKLLQ